MRTPSLAVAVAGAAALVLTVGAAAGVAAGSPTKGNGNGSDSPGKAITVTGAAANNLAPGVPATLTVTVQNPNNQPMVLERVTGSVTAVTTGKRPGIPACSPSWFTLGSFTGSKPIAKKGTATVQLPVTFTNLPGTNQDNCKGVRYSFTFTATGRQA